jgi:epsin
LSVPPFLLSCALDLLMSAGYSQHFNEIMPTIYKRFTEKEAREWRQIYKVIPDRLYLSFSSPDALLARQALQLLEYLVKNGSERVVDDARSHVSMIKILRNFHYIDEKGKDQGINVRNRSRELAELLGDLDRIRQERRKAKQMRNKYTGVAGGAGVGGPSFSSGSSRYGGFSSDQYTSQYGEPRRLSRTFFFP